MAIEFRCEKCGELIQIESSPGQSVKCPLCSEKVVVPAGLASLPQPKVPTQDRPDGPPAASSSSPTTQMQPQVSTESQAEIIDEGEGSERLMSVMSAIMPWVISFFFHVGLALIFAFLTIMASKDRKQEQVIIPDDFFVTNPGALVNPERTTQRKMTQNVRKVRARSQSKQESIPSETRTEEQVTLIARAGGGSGALADLGSSLSGSKGGARSSFAGTGGNAHNIVYLIDRSGSMMDVLPAVLQEIATSVAMLKPNQSFHVILFADGAPLEKTPARLTPATEQNKRKLATFLVGVKAERRTDPVRAINRAFDVLSRSDRSRPGKLIYMLTDAFFPDNEKVLEVIAKRNARLEVKINTFLYGSQPPEAVRVMKKIAEQNGGRYRYVSPDE